MGKKNRKGASKSKAKKEALAAELKDEQALKQVIRSALYQPHESASSEAGGEGEKSEPLEGKVDEAAPKNVLLDFAPFCKYDRRDIDVALEFSTAQQMSGEDAEFVFNLCKTNMEGMYQDSAGIGEHCGWSSASKRAELMDDDARHIIVRSNDGMGTPVGFAHFRFVIEGAYPVLYVYEVQLVADMQRRGLGKHIMQVMELVARKNGMKWIMLTVLHTNVGAQEFYTKKLKYTVDETVRPNVWHYDEDGLPSYTPVRRAPCPNPWGRSHASHMRVQDAAASHVLLPLLPQPASVASFPLPTPHPHPHPLAPRSAPLIHPTPTAH